ILVRMLPAASGKCGATPRPGPLGSGQSPPAPPAPKSPKSPMSPLAQFQIGSSEPSAKHTQISSVPPSKPQMVPLASQDSPCSGVSPSQSVVKPVLAEPKVLVDPLPPNPLPEVVPLVPEPLD